MNPKPVFAPFKLLASVFVQMFKASNFYDVLSKLMDEKESEAFACQVSNAI